MPVHCWKNLLKCHDQRRCRQRASQREDSHGDGSHDDPPKHRHGPEKTSDGNKLQFERVPGGWVL